MAPPPKHQNARGHVEEEERDALVEIKCSVHKKGKKRDAGKEVEETTASDGQTRQRKRKKLHPEVAVEEELHEDIREFPDDAASSEAEVPENKNVEVEGDGQAAEGDSLSKLRALLAPPEAAKMPEAEKVDPEEQLRPDWTERYVVVNSDDPATPLEEITWTLHPALETSLRKSGYDSLFPIQAAVVPLLARGADPACDVDSPYSCDVCVSAPTGQGKTLAYAVPIMEALVQKYEAKPRAIVLLPTRDLAMQVYKVFRKLRDGLAKGTRKVRSLCLTGQQSFKEERLRMERNPPDILVCTPGRLVDHVFHADTKIDLSIIRWFVIDEADRLLTQAYHRWLDILERVAVASSEAAGDSPTFPRLQKLLFSATMTWNPMKLASLRLRRPIYYFSSQTGKYATPKELRQHRMVCRDNGKPLALLYVLSEMLSGALETDVQEGAGRAIVFCSSVDTAHRLARLLQTFTLIPDLLASEATPGSEVMNISRIPEGFRSPAVVAEFSSNLSQDERSKLLKQFRKGVVKCLVCSDVVARGIDIPDVQAVFNYTVPSNIQTYIHRCGRAARAGRIGHAFTFVRKEERRRFDETLKKSADCWERIQPYRMPETFRMTHPWYPRALRLLAWVIDAEEQGRIRHSGALTVETFAGQFALERPAKVGKETEDKVVDEVEKQESSPRKKRKDETADEDDAANVDENHETVPKKKKKKEQTNTEVGDASQAQAENIREEGVRVGDTERAPSNENNRNRRNRAKDHPAEVEVSPPEQRRVKVGGKKTSGKHVETTEVPEDVHRTMADFLMEARRGARS